MSEMVCKLNGRTFDLPLTYSRGGERAPKLEAAGSLSTQLGLAPEAFVADVRGLEAVLLDREVAPEFSFVDNVKEVTFPDTRDGLWTILESLLTSGPNSGETVSLAVPTELLDTYAAAGAFQIRLNGGSWMTPGSSSTSNGSRSCWVVSVRRTGACRH